MVICEAFRNFTFWNTSYGRFKIVFPFYFGFHLPLKTMADVAPITPKKGEYMGLCSAVAILDLCVLSEKMGQVMSELRRGVVTCLQLPESPLDLSHKTRHLSLIHI